jgi:hypothetical protein
MKPRAVDPGWKNYATESQRVYIDAVLTHGSMTNAAKKLGVAFNTVRGAIESAEKRAAMQGYAPDHNMTHPAPAPFVVKGVSTYYNKDGEAAGQWVKTKLDESRVEQVLRDFVADLVKDAKGLSRLIPPPKVSNADLLAVYPIGDPHFGMYAWADEAGKDFDVEIAERVTKGAIDMLVSSAPPAETAIFAPLGDLLHADDSKNRTPQSGNALDVDTRHQRVMRVTLKAMKHCIYRLLEKHQNVIGRILQGNHDPQAAFAIGLALAEHFENNPRVKIDLSPAYYWYHRFGKVLIGLTHGDKARGKDLLGVMASDRAEEWGQTKFRYFYHGHLHERGEKEVPGLLIEWFRTMAPADAWSAGEGYRSGRNMQCIVMHRNFGEIARNTCDVAMLEAA